MTALENRPLGGKTVVITGAARGLGAGYARLAVELGANVVLADVDESELSRFAAELEERETVVRCMVADVSSTRDLRSLVELAIDSFGTLDGFVNNAAVAGSMAEIGEYGEDTVRKMIDVNLLGTIFGTEAAAKAMKLGSGGSIVNVTSGTQSGMSRQSIYGATKGGIASYTYAAAIDLGQYGIRVNAISPLAATRFVEVNEKYRADHGISTHSITLPPPSNNAAAVAFLLSDYSQDVNGQIIRVDNDGISVVSHPDRIDGSLVRGTNWTFEQVAKAYGATLRHHLAPVGNQVSVL
jgi:NAD(P)-dependent dehydrogenase (short-subunit alcohol dehydrogenase family)